MSAVMEDDPDALPEVAAFEHELIKLARALVAPDTADVWSLLGAVYPTPASAIGPTSVALLGDTLQQVWPALWRRGAVPGARPWAKSAPIGLTFGTPTFELLRWLVATPLSAPVSTHPTLPGGAPLSVGDQVAIYLALAAAERTPAQAAIARQPLVRSAPLAWLGFAHVLGEATESGGGVVFGSVGAPLDRPPAAAFEALAQGAGALVVEALARELADRWRAAELGKRGAQDPARLCAIGAAQDATLVAWFAACDHRKRRDLATFVIDAAAPLLVRGLAPEPGRVDCNAPLSVRAAARVAAGSLLRGVAHWATWDQQHRGVRFIDDDYAATQGLLSRFETIGAAGTEQAASWLAQLSALPGA